MKLLLEIQTIQNMHLAKTEADVDYLASILESRREIDSPSTKPEALPVYDQQMLLSSDVLGMRTKVFPLLNAYQIVQLSKKYSRFICGTQTVTNKAFPDNLNEIVKEELYEFSPELEKVFDVTDGKMVVAGGALAVILSRLRIMHTEHRHHYISQGDDIDCFFHSCDPEEATNLVNAVGTVLDTDRSVWRRTTKLIEFRPMSYGGAMLQFITRLYENASQIVGCFDLHASQVMYDPVHGLRATLAGAMAIVTGILPVDVTKRSTTFEGRIKKYVELKGYKFLDRTSGALLERFNSYEYRMHHDHESDYEAENERGFVECTAKPSFLNCWYVRQGTPEKAVLTSETFADIWLVTEDCIEDSFLSETRAYLSFPRREQYTSRELATTFPDRELRTQFVQLLYIDGDMEGAQMVYEKQENYFQSRNFAPFRKLSRSDYLAHHQSGHSSLWIVQSCYH